MRFQKCKNCGTKFIYRALWESFMGGDKSIICSNCGAEHALKSGARLTYAILISLPILFRGVILRFAPLSLLVFLVYGVAIVSLFPYMLLSKFKGFNNNQG